MKDRFLRLTILAIAVLVLAVYLPLLFKANLVASDFPYTSEETVKIGLNLPMAWSYSSGSGFGGNKVFGLWSYPIDFMFGLAATIGLNFKISTLLILIIPGLMAALLGTFYLARSYGLGKYASFGVSVFYLLTTYSLLLLDGGQISIFLAYGIFPLSFYFLNLCKKDNFSIGKIIIYSFFVILLSIADLRFFYIHLFVSFALALLETFFTNKKIAYLFGMAKTTLIAIAVWFTINLFWIYPVFRGQGGETLNYLSSSSQLDFLNFTYLFNSFFLQQPNWPLNSFGRLATPDYLFVLALLPLPVLLYKFRRSLKFNLIVLVYLFGAFLSKGINPPFGWIYESLFIYVPGFSMFRDSSKFFVITSLFFALMVGFFLDSDSRRKRTVISFACLFLYLFSLTNPVWRGKMTGVFSTTQNQGDYEKLNQSIDDQKSFGRVLWLPSRPPMGNTTSLNPALDAFALSNRHLYQSANVGTYERFNFLREPSYSKHLLDISSIGYIAYPLADERKVDLKKEDLEYYRSFTSQLSKMDYLDSYFTSEKLNVFKNDQQQNLVYFTPNLYWILGDQSILNLIPNSKYILDYPLIFVDSLPNLDRLFSDNNYGKFVIGATKTESDLIAQLSISDKEIVKESALSGDYWVISKQMINSFREFINTKHQVDTTDFSISQKVLMFEDDGSLIIQNPEQKDKLLLRVFRSPKSGQLSFGEKTLELSKDNGRVLGGIVTDKERQLYDLGSFNWITMETNGEKELRLNFAGGELNMISDIALLNSDSMALAEKSFNLLKNQNRIIDYSEFALDVSKASTGRSISWQKESPVNYRIKSDIGDGVIVYSQSYDDKWKIGDKQSLPAYSISNLFIYNSQQDSVSIYYSGQDDINMKLFTLSFTTFALLFFATAYIALNYKSKK